MKKLSLLIFIVSFSFLAIAFSSEESIAESVNNQTPLYNSELNVAKDEVEPYALSDRVRNIFKQNYYPGEGWGELYNVTYTTLYFQTGYDYLGWEIIESIEEGGWLNRYVVNTYQDQYSTY